MNRRPRDIFSDTEWTALAGELALSPRQNEILKGIFLGQQNKEIGTRLNISSHTVRTHLRRLYEKFDARRREDLILEIVAAFRAQCRSARCPLQG